MSLASKVTLGASVVFAGATIYFVHWDHMQERERMREGVFKDMARQAEQNTSTKVAMLTKQKEIEKQLKKERADEKRANEIFEIDNLKDVISNYFSSSMSFPEDAVSKQPNRQASKQSS